MVGWMIKRLLLAAVTAWAISVLSFVIIQLPPGDYLDAYIANLQAQGTTFTFEEVASLRAQYGLEKNIAEQYFRWVGLMAQGNFGVSFEFNRPVTEVIGDRLWMTIVITLAALFFTWIVALPIGVYTAVKQYSLGDYVATFVGFIGLAVPDFLLALILLYATFIFFPGADIGGLFSSDMQQAPWGLAKIWNMIQHLPIPAIVLGTAGTAGLIRIMRANLLDELRRPYMVTARAKGLNEWRAIVRYPVRVALNPFASTIGWLLPSIVGGSIIVSIVLSLPTVGPILLKALIAQDMFLAGTIIMLLGLLTVIGTVISDVVLVIIDPRIRFEARS